MHFGVWSHLPPPHCPVPDPVETNLEAERALIALAQTGNEEAFGRLMRDHYEPVFRLVASILRDEHAARDVCQEVWLTVWKNLATFRGEAKFSTWLHPIATRRAIDHLRSRKRWFNRFLPFRTDTDAEDGTSDRTAAAGEAAADGDPRQDLEKQEGNARFERAIDALPPSTAAWYSGTGCGQAPSSAPPRSASTSQSRPTRPRRRAARRSASCWAVAARPGVILEDLLMPVLIA